jgi:hypothetical protein
VAKNCGVWGLICTKAKDEQAATERKLSEARATLKKHGIAIAASAAAPVRWIDTVNTKASAGGMAHHAAHFRPRMP